MSRGRMCTAIVSLALAASFCLMVNRAAAQVSSIGARERAARDARPAALSSSAMNSEPRPGTTHSVYDQYSWISSRPAPPRTFRVGDLITIIVRERREFEADGDLKTRKRLDIQSQLDAFLKLADGGVGSAAFRRGKPNIDYNLNNRLQSDGETEREDRLTTRLTGQIIDVKPNGVLVFEAQAHVQHDDEVSTITFTGSCRKEDVTADNTILSTQVADKRIAVRNEGAVRAASSRGWLLKLLDSISPF